mmetsp:Transcript_96090/g.255296  ORF Transcript_96090/g.255296 Transcript_96090/m.255296 type:complete len:203 (+) Transcript_96090:504-1112(+)
MDGTESMDTTVTTSELHPRPSDTMSILESGGSSGNCDIFRPVGVMSPRLSRAPSIQSWNMEFRMVSCGGGSMKPNSRRFLTPMDFSRSTTLERFVLWISGIVIASISVKYAFSVYKRQHAPGPVRPALPRRWLAFACEMGLTRKLSIPILGLYSFSLQYPVSMTYLMPSTVSDVSAMLVATMILRLSELSKIFACMSDGSCE